MLEGKKMVVTGGAGVLGSSVAAVAEKQGAEVFLIDVIEPPQDVIGKYFQVDLLDAKAANPTTKVKFRLNSKDFEVEEVLL